MQCIDAHRVDGPNPAAGVNLGPLSLMRQRVAALYVADRQRRLIEVNQWDGGIAPRFHLLRTREGCFWRFRHDVPERLAAAIGELAAREPPLDDPRAAPTYRDAYHRLLADGAPIEADWSGPAYGFAQLPSAPDPDVVAIGSSNAELLRPLLEDWLPDVPFRQPFLALVQDGVAVSVCASVRISATAHEAGVATAPGWRRRGLATRAVSAWSAAVHARGATPFYSTSWDNVASQSVARALGLILLGTDYHIR
ncbi:MAG: GNAT family N-acetyltransferase [Pseudomonadales bacterium]